MEQSSLPSNSLMNKEEKPEKKKVKSVVSGKVKKKGKTFGEKVVENFVNEDVEDVKGYLVSDVVIPTINPLIVGYG